MGSGRNAFLQLYPEESPRLSTELLKAFGDDGTLTGRFKSQAVEVLDAVARKFPSEVWQQVRALLGPPMDARAFHITRGLRDGGLTLMRPFHVWAWVDADVEKRGWYAATLVPPVLFRSDTQACWARELLIRYGHREDVRRNLHATQRQNSGAVLQAATVRQRRRGWKILRRTNRFEPAVWLDEEIESLAYRIEQERIREEREF